MKIAFCKDITFKPTQDDKKSHSILVTGFKNLELTIQEVAENIDKGYAFTAQHKDRRKDSNFLCSGFIAVDIDEGWKFEEILELPFVKKYAAIVYTTVSHTPQAHRLRVIFELEEEIVDPLKLRHAVTGAIKYLDGDKACKSACQMFYGSKDCNPEVLGNILPTEQLDILVTLGEGTHSNGSIELPDKINSNLMPKGGTDDRNTKFDAPKRSAIVLVNDQAVMLANKIYSALADLSALTPIFCPIHHDRNASAFVVKNQSGVNGVHCRACKQSFWPAGHSRPALLEYDFFAHEHHIDTLEYEEDPMMHLDESAPPEYWSNDLRQVQRRNQKYISNVPLTQGVTYLSSPKGTGKTALLKKLVAECRATTKSVLVIGHRQLLLGELARNLGLHFYKDKIDYSADTKDSKFEYLAICIDSMPLLLNTARERYDVIIIDESEQVFRHLVSQTLAANRRACYFQIEFFVKYAQSVILSDADLGFLTINTVERMLGHCDNSKLYVNSHKPDSAAMDLYQSKNHLIADMKEIVRSGGRHFICCNSKTTAILLKQILVADGKSADKIMLITSKNSKQKDVVEFLKDIKTAILSIDVLIASPSLGTGIDITFDNAEQLVDTVFGFFDANITTHFDLDQQLARVRHPKAVKAWVSPMISYVETNPSVIKDFYVSSGKITDSLTGYDASGHPKYDADDKILTLYADVMSITNASKNNLKKHFIDLKLRNGWEVNRIEKSEAELQDITHDIREAKEQIEEEEVTALMEAKKLSETEFQILLLKKELRPGEHLALQKYKIEKFYGEEVSRDLIKLDNHGNFRRQLATMKLVMSNHFELVERDARRNERLSMDRENNSLKAELLQELMVKSGVADYRGNFDLDQEFESSMLKSFASHCVQNIYNIKALFGINVRGDVKEKPITQLNVILQLCGMKMKKRGMKTTSVGRGRSTTRSTGNCTIW
jgi:hypothetical protein